MALRRPLAVLIAATLSGVVSLWVAFRVATPGDYPVDAGPAMHLLLAGRIGAALAQPPAMGLLTLVLRLPFAALGADELGEYRWGVVPCVLSAGVAGLALGRAAGRRGAPAGARVLLFALCLLNPLTLQATRWGHPEEIVGAALCVLALIAALDGHDRRAVLLLGLAVATKQWAVLAVAPVALMTRRPLRALVGAGLLAALLAFPFVLADPGRFAGATRTQASAGNEAATYSVWAPLASPTQGHFRDADGTLVAVHGKHLSAATAWLSHPAIVALGVLLALLAWARARRSGLRALDSGAALAVLALALLLRCMLDPLDNLYYHLPLLLALAAWDAARPRGRLPLRALAGTGAAYALFEVLPAHLSRGQLTGAYLGVAGPAALWMLAVAMRMPAPRTGGRFRPRAGDRRMDGRSGSGSPARVSRAGGRLTSCGLDTAR